MKIAIYLFCLLLGFCAPKKSVPKASFTFEAIGELPPHLKECSGIAAYGPNLIAINDSQRGSALHLIDTQATHLETMTFKGIKNHDWESLFYAKGKMYIGDFGNNYGRSKHLSVQSVELKEPNAVNENHFIYASQTKFDHEGQNHPYDCEAMVVIDEGIYLFSKDWVNFTTDIYKVDTKTKEKQSLTSLQNIDVDGLITGATVNADGRVVLCGYQSNLSAFVVFLDYNNGKFNLIKRYETPIVGAQIEGITYYGKDPSGKNIYYLVSESMNIKRGKIKLKQPGRLYRLKTNL